MVEPLQPNTNCTWN